MKRLSVKVISFAVLLIAVSVFGESQWQPLRDDALHDASNPALEILQEPMEALSLLQPDPAGNKVNWVTALRNGEIEPRSSLLGDNEPEILDLDIVMTATLPMPNVIFPHRAHTEWMSCVTCHEELFVSRTGANPINMFSILEGEHCGRCHGAVSFPLTECNRCHSVPPENVYRAPPSGGVRRPER